MLDVRQLRADPDLVKALLARRGESTAPLDAVLQHDQRLRQVSRQADELRAEVKRISAEVGKLTAIVGLPVDDLFPALMALSSTALGLEPASNTSSLPFILKIILCGGERNTNTLDPTAVWIV